MEKITFIFIRLQKFFYFYELKCVWCKSESFLIMNFFKKRMIMISKYQRNGFYNSANCISSHKLHFFV
ncbi:hypothetical protein LEP1GSC008_2122 [Leptospira kirschneri serovar Bulgarica str. Nikolaevo]|uniref:Uncharacterized protein n=2 Tax=Leptospira kirschneri TaxID=29507 RepID=A0A0E2B133_9LEPT|nr:hypothetical protein LEP1GSC081_3857 [Leptospira kirschneri str. H1]EMK25410.1 hypothetical protein LEP1GSC008_2122 [Leptospira kirschneri serovar Bulgarica str. Nikolaevo]